MEKNGKLPEFKAVVSKNKNKSEKEAEGYRIWTIIYIFLTKIMCKNKLKKKCKIWYNMSELWYAMTAVSR